MNFNQQELTRIAEIINTAFASSEFKQTKVSSTDINPQKEHYGLDLVQFNEQSNPFDKIFSNLSANRKYDKGQFYHFKSVELSKSIIENKSIQASNLISNQENDFAEYSEFFKRLGLFNQLIPKDFCEQQKLQVYNPASESLMDEERDNNIILCFTKDAHKEIFWEKYAMNDTGVCLAFRLINFDLNPDSYTIDFRDVTYDTGYRFDFLNHINYHLAKEFGKHLLIDGISKFAKFYKRGSYEWENETRLSFNYKLYGKFLNTHYNLKSTPNSSRKYIEIPLEGNQKINQLFNLTIDEVICGKCVSKTDYEVIEKLLAQNFPQAKIWQRI